MYDIEKSMLRVYYIDRATTFGCQLVDGQPLNLLCSGRANFPAHLLEGETRYYENRGMAGAICRGTILYAME